MKARNYALNQKFLCVMQLFKNAALIYHHTYILYSVIQNHCKTVFLGKRDHVWEKMGNNMPVEPVSLQNLTYSLSISKYWIYPFP